MHEPVRDDDGRAAARFEDSVNHSARDARLAGAHLVGEHDTAFQQSPNDPGKRCALSGI